MCDDHDGLMIKEQCNLMLWVMSWVIWEM